MCLLEKQMSSHAFPKLNPPSPPGDSAGRAGRHLGQLLCFEDCKLPPVNALGEAWGGEREWGEGML